MLTEQVHARVVYGMGAPCDRLFHRQQVENRSVRELIDSVINSPQRSEPARRAASVLAEAMRSGRVLSVQVVRGPNGDATIGQPVLLDDIALPKERRPANVPEEITIHASEPWVGGGRRI